jgi:hypothetical protein
MERPIITAGWFQPNSRTKSSEPAQRSMAFLVSTFITSRLAERKARSPHPKRRSRNSGMV